MSQYYATETESNVGTDKQNAEGVMSNIEEAAKAVGVSGVTLIKWMKIPEFDQAFREARRDAFRQSVGRMQQA
jgi:hypothetical protein